MICSIWSIETPIHISPLNIWTYKYFLEYLLELLPSLHSSNKYVFLYHEPTNKVDYFKLKIEWSFLKHNSLDSLAGKSLVCLSKVICAWRVFC
jgi:hypothetical protein